MSNIELQQLMVINKRNQLGWKIKLKSLVLDLAAWSVWAYLVYFIISYFDKIFLSPIVGQLYLSEVLTYAFYFVVALLVTAILWSFISRDPHRQRRIV